MNEYIGMIMFNSELFKTEYVKIFADDEDEAMDKLDDYVDSLKVPSEMYEIVEANSIKEIE